LNYITIPLVLFRDTDFKTKDKISLLREEIKAILLAQSGI